MSQNRPKQIVGTLKIVQVFLSLDFLLLHTIMSISPLDLFYECVVLLFRNREEFTQSVWLSFIYAHLRFFFFSLLLDV